MRRKRGEEKEEGSGGVLRVRDEQNGSDHLP
jgi:hypothetical protein